MAVYGRERRPGTSIAEPLAGGARDALKESSESEDRKIADPQKTDRTHVRDRPESHHGSRLRRARGRPLAGIVHASVGEDEDAGARRRNAARDDPRSIGSPDEGAGGKGARRYHAGNDRREGEGASDDARRLSGAERRFVPPEGHVRRRRAEVAQLEVRLPEEGPGRGGRRRLERVTGTGEPRRDARQRQRNAGRTADAGARDSPRRVELQLEPRNTGRGTRGVRGGLDKAP